MTDSLSDLGAEIIAQSVIKAFAREDAKPEPVQGVVDVESSVPGAPRSAIQDGRSPNSQGANNGARHTQPDPNRHRLPFRPPLELPPTTVANPQPLPSPGQNHGKPGRPRKHQAHLQTRFLPSLALARGSIPMHQKPMSRNPKIRLDSLRETLTSALSLGCQVKQVRRTAELRISPPEPGPVMTINGRRKDCPRALAAFLRRIELRLTQCTGGCTHDPS